MVRPRERRDSACVIARTPAGAAPRGHALDHAARHDPPVVGKSTRAESEAPGAIGVQCKIEGTGAARQDPEQLHAVAARGVESATAEFPHRQRIEALFGRPVMARAALGGDARAACDALGAAAYARGDQVAFASPQPDLHVAAHEAAHTLQQRGGVQLAGGFGQAGDHHEQLADQAADRVVRGEPAGDLFGDAPRAGSGAPAVQRVILASPEPTPADVIDTANKVAARPEFQGISTEQRDRLTALAIDEDNAYTIAQAIELTRNTVVAAVDGVGGAREGNFVASAWQKRKHVSAYDPHLQPALRNMLTQHGVPTNTSPLSQSSVTAFGQHVPNTDVYVPHPGPWVEVGPPDDLATCLERVLGPNSRAFVVTDNETSSDYAGKLQTRIQHINTQNAHAMGYRPLVVQIQPIVPQHSGGGLQTSVDGIPLTLGHQPNYRLVTITRT